MNVLHHRQGETVSIYPQATFRCISHLAGRPQDRSQRAREVRIKEQTKAHEVIAFIRVGNLAQNHRKLQGREAGPFELLPASSKIPGYTALREINPTNVPWPPDANARRTCEASGVTEFAEVDILFVRIVTLTRPAASHDMGTPSCEGPTTGTDELNNAVRFRAPN